MRILDRMEKSTTTWFLIGTAFFFFLLRLPSLFEPLWYGDEGIYQAVGMALRKGALLYTQTWDNKTPLLYFVYALFSSDQFGVRFASLIAGLLSIFVFFLLAKMLFSKTKTAFFTTGMYAILFGLPILEGNIANSENFMLFFILLAGYFVVGRTSKKELLYLFLAGVSLAIAFLFKIVGIFDFAALLFFMAFVEYNGLKKINTQFFRLAPFIVGFLGPIVLVVVVFLFFGTLGDFFAAAFQQNVGYINYGNKFYIPQGLLILKLLLLSGFLLLLFRLRETFSKSSLFILIWFAFSLFNAFFAQRPYTHYLLVLLPSFLLLVGMISFERFTEKGNAKTEDILRRNITLLAIVAFLFVATNFRIFLKTVFYYQNFLSFVTQGKSVEAYQAFFDRNTPRDYEVAHYLKNHLLNQDAVFVWGNNAQLYTFLNKVPPTKYTVVYHMIASPKTLRETKIQLDQIKPRFIIAVSKDPLFPTTAHYREKIMIKDTVIYERVN